MNKTTAEKGPFYSTCEVGTNVIACGPPRGVYHRRIQDCPECKRRHRFVIRWDGAWYGTTDYGSCGDYWQEDWRGPRPARRGWRKEAQEQFRAMWDNAAPRDLYDAYVNADIELTLGDDWESAAERRDSAVRAIWAHQGQHTATEGTPA